MMVMVMMVTDTLHNSLFFLVTGKDIIQTKKTKSQRKKLEKKARDNNNNKPPTNQKTGK
jgi:hypothetical protein